MRHMGAQPPFYFPVPGDESPPHLIMPPPHIAPRSGGFSVKKKPVLIRSVWSENLDYEFFLIRNAVDRYPFVSMDTEFPGVVFRLQHHYSDPFDHYQTLKSNVDALKLIQVGIVLSDSLGNLPDFGCPDSCFIWEFNFCDFDVSCDDHAPNSIELLRQHGIDFEINRVFGASVSRFAERMVSSGLLCNGKVTYITFHSGYDFGYLIKAITGTSLPRTLPEFLRLLGVIFGNRIYDVKHLMRFCPGLYGGLDKVAKSLGIERVVGRAHQAGSDSLLTWHVFEKIWAMSFSKDEKQALPKKYAGVLYGLEASDPLASF